MKEKYNQSQGGVTTAALARVVSTQVQRPLMYIYPTKKQNHPNELFGPGVLAVTFALTANLDSFCVVLCCEFIPLIFFNFFSKIRFS